MAKMPREQVDRLFRAVGYSIKQLKPFRDMRLEMLKLYVGSNYSEYGPKEATPVNLTELTINTYLHRIANPPNVLVTTPYFQLKHKANLLEMALNHLIENELRFADTLQMVALEAIVGMGIIKTGITPTTQYGLQGFLSDPGQPFADHVGLDDWVHDMTATRWDLIQFCGNSYRMPYELAMDSGIFKKNKDKIVPPSAEHNPESDASLSQGGAKGDADHSYMPTIKLWDFWLPNEGLMMTCQQTGDNTEEFSGIPLRIFKWEGPESGPFRRLSFNHVPNNIMPVPPAWLFKDMADLANALFRKLSRQANRQKTFYGVRRGGEGDGTRIQEARDGQMIAMDDPNNVREITTGGVNRESMAFMIWMRDLFSYLQGNLDAMGGLGPQADTLGQEQMIQVNSNVRISKMRQNVERFCADVMRDVADYLWYDPHFQLPLVKKTPLEGYEVQVDWTKEMREGELLDYNIQIEPYSVMRRGPEEKMQLIERILQQTVIPLLPMAQESGATVDLEKLVKMFAKYGRLPELEEIVRFGNPKHPMEQPVQPPKAPVTTRNYVRHNRPGATRQGHDQTMQSVLLGGNPQESEKSALFRPVG